MSSFLFPYTTLPGVQFDYSRYYLPATLVQEAMSGVTSTIGLRSYPLVHFEYDFEFLRDYNGEKQALEGLINAVGGRFDTFLHTDPDFNTVSNMQFVTTDGVTTLYALTANNQNIGGPGTPELIQNLNGAAVIYVDRFTGTGTEILSPTSRTNYLLQSQTLATTWTATNVTPTNASQTAPDGTTTGTKILETTANAVHTEAQTVTIPSASADVTFSIWVEANFTRTWAGLQVQENTGNTVINQTFNLTSTGSLGTTHATGTNWSNLRASIAQFGAYYRISITGTKTNAATGLTATLFVSNADSLAAYTGVATDGLTAWGAQLELDTIGAGAPSFYLVTTAATVTQTDYTQGATAAVQFSFTPLANWLLSWSGSFYYRCRFDEDHYEFKKFMKGLWTVDKVTFTSMTL